MATDNQNNWMYEWQWQAYTPDAAETPSPLGNWLVVSTTAGSNAVIDLIQAKGGKVRSLNLKEFPQTKASFVALLQEEVFDRILYLAGTSDDAPPTEVSIEEALRVGAQGFFCLCQALIALYEKIKSPLFLITPPAIAYSPLKSLVDSVLVEHQELFVKQIELDTSWDQKLLLPILFSKDQETRISLRADRAYTPRLVRGKQENATSILPTATYLITGGMGGMGKELAKWLLDQGAGHVVLTGRNPLSTESGQFLTGNQRLSYESLDIGDESKVRAVIERINQSSMPLKGVFHLAGIRGEFKSLKDTEWSQYETYFKAKIFGAFYLHLYTKELDYFVAFSSLSSSIPVPGVGNYAAANAFLDALCKYRQKQGMPALSICWGPWSEVGIGKGDNSENLKRGIISFSPKEGMQAFEVALRSKSSHILIANIDWNAYGKLWFKIPTWLLSYAQQKEGDHELLTLLEKTETSRWPAVVKKHLQEKLRVVLKIPESLDIEDTEGFFELGMDSLSATKFRNMMQAGLGERIVLKSTVAFDYPDLETLTAYVISQLGASEPKPVEANTDADKGIRGELKSRIDSASEDELLKELSRQMQRRKESE